MLRQFFTYSSFILLLIGFIGSFIIPSKLIEHTSVALAATDPVIAVAGNIACDPLNSGFNGGNGTATTCRQKYTSDLLVNANLAAVLTLGDNQYQCGGFQAYMQSYDLSWGRVKSITYPSLGNHDYLTSGTGTGCTSANAGAAGTFDYFGAAAGLRGQGYYSFDIGAWHIIALNSNCSAVGGCGVTSPQGQWLQNDLASHANMCTLAYFHHPLFSSGVYESSTALPFWQLLYQSDVELVLNGHDHIYERFAPQTPNGVADPNSGIRQFTVGTGGRSHHSISQVAANSEVRNNTTFGVLKLTLHPTSYDWQFVPEAGGSFTDSGSGPCRAAPPPPTSNPLYASFASNGSVGGLSFADEDIMKFDGSQWSYFFDGSDVGVGDSDISGFTILDSDSFLMSFTSSFTVNGVSVTPQDVVRFDATSLGFVTSGVFSMHLNGIDVGLDTTAENIDSVSLLPDGSVLISTTGNPVVAGVTGGRDEDVLAFTPTALGNNTSGSWALYFDGSDVGLAEASGEDIDALDVTPNGDIYLSTVGDFAVTGISGADEDVFVCAPGSIGSMTACTYSPALYFDGSAWGLSANDVDAFSFPTDGFPPPSTPTHTPTMTPIAAVTTTPTSTNTPSIGGPDLIFGDGFEGGNLSAWSSSNIDAGDLSVSPSAALVGSQGMQALIDDSTAMYVTDDRPNAEPRYRARFYFDPNSISMADGDAHILFRGYSGSTIVLRVEFGFSAAGYQLRTAFLNDGTTWTENDWFPLTDTPHSIEFDWRAATGEGANNGALTVWIDGVQQADLTGIDNDTRRIDRIWLGAVAGIDAGTRGTYYFDAFESRRQSYIGP